MSTGTQQHYLALGSYICNSFVGNELSEELRPRESVIGGPARFSAYHQDQTSADLYK